jgi:hypothetical protein
VLVLPAFLAAFFALCFLPPQNANNAFGTTVNVSWIPLLTNSTSCRFRRTNFLTLFRKAKQRFNACASNDAYYLKKIKDLGDREAQNIFKLEMNEILAEEPFLKPFPEILPFSPFQVSLGSSRRTPVTPFHSE